MLTSTVLKQHNCKECDHIYVILPLYLSYYIELWQTVSGRFISVIGANISCRCARSSTGISPLAHTGDGYIDLILIRKTSRARYLQHLIKVSEKTVDQVILLSFFLKHLFVFEYIIFIICLVTKKLKYVPYIN